MKKSLPESWRKSMPWLVLALLSAVVLLTRLQMSFDLSAFFPQQTNLTHDILLEQLRNGPGSRLLVIGVKGESHDQLIELSESLREELAANPLFANVLNGEFSEDSAATPEPIASYYLLMGDVDYSLPSLRQALQSRLSDLAFGGGTALLELIARDPFLITLDVLERLAPVDTVGDMWFAGDGSAVLMAETRAGAIDLNAQSEAVNSVKEAFAGLGGTANFKLEMTGVGAFGVELQRTIRAEAKKRTILATSALFLVLLVVYRKPRFVFLATMPLGMGFLVGLALLALIFESVHGITLAFGFTLLGIAIDYPLHLFSHSRYGPGREVIKSIWPTMRLGALSTAIAYMALTFSGSEGLAQLGVFTASGLVVAVLASRSWLPYLLPETGDSLNSSSAGKNNATLRFLPAIAVLGVALFAISRVMDSGLWDDNLSSLSPVPEQRLKTDISLRSAAGTPDMRYQLVLHNSSLEVLLRESEAVDQLLADAVSDGLVDSWQSVSQILPSQEIQRIRREAIPDEVTLRARLSEVLADTPFRSDAFASFELNAARAKTLPSLIPAHIAGTPLELWLDSHLVHLDDQWVSLITLSNPRPAALLERTRTWGPELEMVDLRESSVTLMRDYRNSAVKTISIAALLIIALLWFERKQARQTLWIALIVSTALAVTVSFVTAFHTSMTVIHLVALLLVLGLGLDYALFFSRAESDAGRKATRQAVMAGAASTTLAFGVLAGSSIPVLRFLGLTVAAGSAASFLLAWTGSQLSHKKISRADD